MLCAFGSLRRVVQSEPRKFMPSGGGGGAMVVALWQAARSDSQDLGAIAAAAATESAAAIAHRSCIAHRIARARIACRIFSSPGFYCPPHDLTMTCLPIDDNLKS
mmetsp:Transcript_1212/g.2160  ORF Transcript_1212/g.2160 Transcript_1212/m.2160 type:complete len:105 (+) Transcript_1212:114-428(+)